MVSPTLSPRSSRTWWMSLAELNLVMSLIAAMTALRWRVLRTPIFGAEGEAAEGDVPEVEVAEGDLAEGEGAEEAASPAASPTEAWPSVD